MLWLFSVLLTKHLHHQRYMFILLIQSLHTITCQHMFVAMHYIFYHCESIMVWYVYMLQK